MMTLVGILKLARARIAEREHWVVGVRACGARGGMVNPRSPRAVAWCAGGALLWAGRSQYAASVYEAYEILEVAAIEFDYESVEELNDAASHVLVMRMFDRAIEMASAREAAEA